MRYVEAKRNEARRKGIYEAYITETVRNISENVAKGLGQEAYIARRYTDIIDPRPQKTETAEEIINRIRTKLENI